VTLLIDALKQGGAITEFVSTQLRYVDRYSLLWHTCTDSLSFSAKKCGPTKFLSPLSKDMRLTRQEISACSPC
jgi:hypothetical protein